MQRKWIDHYIDLLYRGSLKDAYQFKQDNIPSSLFRYDVIKPSRIQTLAKGEIHLSAPSMFNDKYDTKGIYYSDIFLKSVYERFKVTPPEFQGMFDTLLDNYYEHCGIACLTEDRDNYPMWWSYADDYKGYCIEYDFETLINTSPQDTNDLHPIMYLDEKFNFDNLLIALTDDIKADEPAVTPAMIIFHTFLGTMKHISWAYEKEWRYIKLLMQGNISMPAKVKAIYLGCNFEKENIPQLETIAKEQNFNIYQLSTSNHTKKSFSFEETLVV